jgi:AcrR family transcriptional regulator
LATHESAWVRRGQILQAALECFGEKGLHAARMDDLVVRSGLSKGAIYFHFKSKHEIFLALFDDFERQLMAEWDELPDGSALEALSRIGDLTLRRLLEMRSLLDAWTEFLRQPESRARMAEVYRVNRERVAALLRRGIDRGELRDCDADPVAAGLVALIEGLLLQAFVDPDFDALSAWPASWALARAGLEA